MGKSAKASGRLLCLGMVCMLLAACRGQEIPPVITPTPTPISTPAATPAPRNPVEEVLGRFQAAYAPFLEDMGTVAAQTPAYLWMEMDAREQLLRMQMVLQPPAGLLRTESGETDASEDALEAGGWSGLLFGAWSGSGSISGKFGDATFSCTLADGGRISGMLLGSAVDGIWEEYLETDIPILDEDGEIDGYEGAYHPVCSVSMALAEVGWVLAVDWRGEQTLLCVAEDAVYFAKDRVLQAAYGSAPQEWADWCFRESTFEEFAPAEIEVPELEGEEGQDA